MRILVAEDSTLERRILQAALEGLGHECLLAADGIEAWALFTESGADVVVSDWLMPGLDGVELCNRVRNHPAPGYTYFIFLTALGEREHILEAMTAGADDYLVKPLDSYQLRMRLIAAARVTELHRRLRESEHERGRLEGVRLAAQTLEHELRNALTKTSGFSYILANRPGVPPDLQRAAHGALSGVRDATEILKRLSTITRIAETHWGQTAGSTIDVARSELLDQG